MGESTGGFKLSEYQPKWKLQCKFPDFDKIIEGCKLKIMLKYYKYQNSWIDCSDWKFWKKRLRVEINEIWKAKTKETFQEEISDAINVLSMMYENADSRFQADKGSESSA